ncbi:MAG: D-alanine--D-alanine ligase A [Treponema sp.]|nr:MAG: D-alanine--D-alanine ligase A [Treponema sp.]
MNITIIYGGKSGEHEVSLNSATSVAKNISTEHTVNLIGINKYGKWFLQSADELERIKQNENAILKITENDDAEVFVLPAGGNEKALSTKTKSIPTDVVFPVLHGSFGEDGTIQGLFEMADIPYVGGGVMSSSVAMDKEKTKTIWKAEGLPVVPYVSIKYPEWKDNMLREKMIAHTEKELDYPLFVKPSSGGSSVGAGRATNHSQLISCIENAFLWDQKVLIETAIPAREIECSVTGNSELTAYTPGEVIPTHEFYDYEAKYTDPNGADLKIPADITNDQRKTIRDLAIKAYSALDLAGFSRVDFFIDKRTNNIYINEINTLPGFTSISMFPKMCIASGLPYNKLIMQLLELAIQKFKTKKVLHSNLTKQN